MKRLFFILIVVTFGFTSGLSNAQVNVNINLNSQPKWGPSGYDYVESYYLPQHDIYYSVPKHGYYYPSGGKWLFSSSLPARYRQINLYQTPKIVLVDRYPYKKHKLHYNRYAQYRVVRAPKQIANHYRAKPQRISYRKSPKYRYAKVGHSPKRHHHKEKFRHPGGHHHTHGPKGHR